MCRNLEFTQMDHSVNTFSESKFWFKYVQRLLQNRLDNCFQNHYKNYLFNLNYISQLLEPWLNILKQAVLSLWSGEQVKTEKIKHPFGKLRKYIMKIYLRNKLPQIEGITTIFSYGSFIQAKYYI